MKREAQIPLFLWVATAIVAHLLGGGGVTEAVKVIEEKMDIQSFASGVRSAARMSAKPIEVSFVEEDEKPEDAAPEPSDPNAPVDSDSDSADDFEAPEATPDPIVEDKDAPEEELAEKQAPQAEKAPEKKATPADEAAQKLAMLDQRRIAVQQHVDNQNQEDNPDAKFAGEHANHVDEETAAQITSTDQNNRESNPGGNFAGSEPQPGNSEDHRVAQSDEAAGDPSVGPGEAGSDDPEDAEADRNDSDAQAAQRAQVASASSASSPEQKAQQSQRASRSQDGMAETVTSPNGAFGIRRAEEARRAQELRRRLAARSKKDGAGLLGFGSSGTTANGVNLNLSQSAAQAMIDTESVSAMRKRAGERRLSQHRGSWQTMGIEKWRPALENYVAGVKPGNQTALNAAHQPFATYLNQIHLRLHQIFADDFLQSLARLPKEHPLNNENMSTHMEIVLNKQDGRIVKLGITKSSGVTMFDVGALEAVKSAAPYGIPPGSIVSSDGNVYLHWEFHRKAIYACSTYFARPYILDLDQRQSPPRVDPPKRPEYDDKKPEQRSGSLDGDDAPERRQRPREHDHAGHDHSHG